MVKVKFLRGCIYGGGKSAKENEVLDIDPSEAGQLVKMKRAEFWKAPPPAQDEGFQSEENQDEGVKDEGKQETAATPPPSSLPPAPIEIVLPPQNPPVRDNVNRNPNRNQGNK